MAAVLPFFPRLHANEQALERARGYLELLGREAVLRSVRRTGRLLVADEDYLGFGLTGEIAAIVAENLDTV